MEQSTISLLVLAAVELPDATDPRHLGLGVVVPRNLGLLLRLLLELRVPRLVPHVVGLVVQHEQAARTGEAFDERGLNGLESLGLT